MSIRAIPEWALRGPAMRVPCDMYDFLWIGADGCVQLCYAAFPLGNINEKPLREIAYRAPHIQAAQDAFHLRCPNCHCEREARIRKHLPSRLAFGLVSLAPKAAQKAGKPADLERAPSGRDTERIEPGEHFLTDLAHGRPKTQNGQYGEAVELQQFPTCCQAPGVNHIVQIDERKARS